VDTTSAGAGGASVGLTVRELVRVEIAPFRSAAAVCLVAERSRKDTEDREAWADSLTLQKAGAVLFVVGAFLSAAGGVVA
jgi:hypothetical protein